MINRNLVAVALMCSALTLGGCATHGATALKDETKTTVRSKLTVGKTTKEDVVAMYGQPQNVKTTQSGETYVYVLSKTHSGDLFHSLDKSDLENAAGGALIGVTGGNVGAGAVLAGSSVVAGRLGQAANKSDQQVDKSLIVKFNNRGVVSSYSLH